ncbi:MAG: hypothetical protein WCT52_03120 [Candidatus Micrarchaeia archaeon]
MGKLCDNCKRNGRVWCPHNAALEIRARLSGSLKQEMFGPTPPNFFVGHNFYPNVYWGPMVSAQAEAPVDDPAQMYGMGMERIIESRAAMIRGMKRGNVKTGGRVLEEAQLSVMSIKPVDAETRFSRTPVFSLELDNVAHPMGASAPIEKFRMADNPVVPKKVDEMVDENILAQSAIRELLLTGFDVHYLTKLLTAGILGRKDNRKMVPTKWAITATDDMAAKRFMESVRDYREIGQPLLYSNTYLDNHFEILLMPGNWEYEQFETALTQELETLQKKRKARDNLNYSSAAWADWKYDGRINMSEEHEPFSGRTAYAESQGGGYYAARFAVAEALYRMGRQARAIVFREIGTGYNVPVGVWEVRENVRHAFLNPPEKFETRESALSALSERLAVPVKEYVKRSRILAQRRLNEF